MHITYFTYALFLGSNIIRHDLKAEKL